MTLKRKRKVKMVNVLSIVVIGLFVLLFACISLWFVLYTLDEMKWYLH